MLRGEYAVVYLKLYIQLAFSGAGYLFAGMFIHPSWLDMGPR